MNCRRVPVAFITCGSNRQGCLGFRASYQSSFKFEPSIVAVISAVGGLDLEEWALLRRVLGLIKECAPRHSGNAHGRLGTIRLCAVQACHVRRQRWRVAFSFHVRQSGGGTMSRWNLKRALVAHRERVSADSRSRSAVLVCGRDRGRSPGAAPHLARAPPIEVIEDLCVPNATFCPSR